MLKFLKSKLLKEDERSAVDCRAGAADPASQARHAFWAAVQSAEQELFSMPLVERMAAVNAMLQPAFPGLTAEILVAKEDDRLTVVLTAEGMIEHFEELMALAHAKPALPRIDVVAFRQRTKHGFSMRMSDFELESNDVLVRHAADRGKVALQVGFSKQIPMDMIDHAKNMAFIMLDHVLGEYDFAVKIGPIDFADPGEATGFDGLPLDQLVATFDAFWRDDLGHNGAFEHGEGRRTLLEATREIGGEEVNSLVSRNDSANALVSRADMGHCLSASVSVQSHEELQWACKFEDQLEAALHDPQNGCRATTILELGTRTVTFYVCDGVRSLARAKSIARTLELDAQFELTFDPAWNNYCRWL